jgi:hypothetical protein
MLRFFEAFHFILDPVTIVQNTLIITKSVGPKWIWKRYFYLWILVINQIWKMQQAYDKLNNETHHLIDC